MLDWTEDSLSLHSAVRRRLFRPRADGGQATGALYEADGTPADAPLPLICMQHGGSSSKTGQDVLDAAEVFTARGCRVLALDGPVHGARLAEPLDGLATRERFLALWRESPAHVEDHVARWHALLEEAARAWPGAQMRWFGVSMGTAYGLPLLARTRRIARAVLGMWGTSYPQSLRLLDDAARVPCPVLFQQKWDDELFTREGQLALFDALGTPDKRLHAYPGGHVRIAGEQMEDLVRFLCA